MRKITVLLVLLALVMMSGLVMAQETPEPTPEPTADVTAEPTAEPTADSTEGDEAAEVTAEATDEADIFVPTVLVRIAHFASDVPVLTPFVNGERSRIQVLSFPSITGWVEIPEGASLSLVPEGGTAADAVVGPVSLDSTGRWGTIAVVGSQAEGTLTAYLLRENLAPLPDGCAAVTVFHGIQGGPAFDVVSGDGAVLGTSVGFPGADSAMAVPSTGAGASSQCAPANEMTEADASGEMAATEEAPAEVQSTRQTGSIADCTVIPVGLTTGGTTDTSEVMATEEASTTDTTDTSDDAAATEEANSEEADSEETSTSSTVTTSAVRAPALRQGQRVANCAYTFLVPAGMAGLSANAVGSSDVLWSLTSAGIEANTYYFFAVIGTADAPQVFSYSVGGGTLSGVMIDAEDIEASDLVTEVEATPEVTPDSTEEGA